MRRTGPVKGGAGRGKGGVGWGSHLEETDALDRDDGCREGWDGAWGGQDAALDGLGVQLAHDGVGDVEHDPPRPLQLRRHVGGDLVVLLRQRLRPQQQQVQQVLFAHVPHVGRVHVPHGVRVAQVVREERGGIFGVLRASRADLSCFPVPIFEHTTTKRCAIPAPTSSIDPLPTLPALGRGW